MFAHRPRHGWPLWNANSAGNTFNHLAMNVMSRFGTAASIRRRNCRFRYCRG
jgi:hypothetical protein